MSGQGNPPPSAPGTLLRFFAQVPFVDDKGILTPPALQALVRLQTGISGTGGIIENITNIISTGSTSVSIGALAAAIEQAVSAPAQALNIGIELQQLLDLVTQIGSLRGLLPIGLSEIARLAAVEVIAAEALSTALRALAIPPPTGGGSTIAIDNNGSSVGTAGTLDTAGGMTLSLSGSTATILGRPGRTPGRLGIGSFTWVNQAGSSAVDHTNGPLSVNIVGASTGSNNNALFVTAVPGSTPWTVTMEMRNYLFGQPFQSLGLFIYDTGSGKCEFFGMQAINAGSYFSLCVLQFTSPTVFSAQPYVQNMAFIEDIWLRVTNDGTNLTYYLSLNGADWVSVYSEGVSSFMPAITSAGPGGEVSYRGTVSGDHGSPSFEVNMDVWTYVSETGTGTNTTWT